MKKTKFFISCLVLLTTFGLGLGFVDFGKNKIYSETSNQIISQTINSELSQGLLTEVIPHEEGVIFDDVEYVDVSTLPDVGLEYGELDTYCLLDEYFVPTENQSMYGFCWSFATNKAIETFFAMNTNEYINLSEAWNGLCYKKTNTAYSFGSGGNASYVENSINSGKGVMLETDFEYELAQTVGENTYNNVYENYSQYASNQLISNIHFVYLGNYRNAVNADDIKASLKNYIAYNGGVYMSIQANMKTNSDGSTYVYEKDSSIQNLGHGVTCVGWDDNYSFVDENSVTHTGAWICLNSWGYDARTFYVSYEDFWASLYYRVIGYITINGYKIDLTSDTPFAGYENALFLESSNSDYSSPDISNPQYMQKNVFGYSTTETTTMTYSYSTVYTNPSFEVKVYDNHNVDVSNLMTASVDRANKKLTLSQVNPGTMMGTYKIKVTIDGNSDGVLDIDTSDPLVDNIDDIFIKEIIINTGAEFSYAFSNNSQGEQLVQHFNSWDADNVNFTGVIGGQYTDLINVGFYVADFSNITEFSVVSCPGIYYIPSGGSSFVPATATTHARGGLKWNFKNLSSGVNYITFKVKTIDNNEFLYKIIVYKKVDNNNDKIFRLNYITNGGANVDTNTMLGIIGPDATNQYVGKYYINPLEDYQDNTINISTTETTATNTIGNYIFKGWYFDSDFLNPLPTDANNKQYLVYSDVSSKVIGASAYGATTDGLAITLFAKYDRLYSVDYELGDGTMETAVVTNYFDSEIIDNPITITQIPTPPEGYFFAGWTGGGNTTPTRNPIISNSDNGDIVFTANYEIFSYNIVYCENTGSKVKVGGVFVGIPSEALNYFDSLTTPKAGDGIYKDGSTLIGWKYTTIENATSVQLNPLSLLDLDATYSMADIVEPLEILENHSNIYFYAIWRENTYTLAFDMNGGTAIEPSQFETQTGVLDSTQIVMSSSTDVEKTAYYLNGWSIGEGEELYQIPCEATRYIGSDLAEVLSQRTDGSTITLKAVWACVEYTISFVYGENDIDDLTYNIETLNSDNKNLPTFNSDNGYTFTWKVSAPVSGNWLIDKEYSVGHIDLNGSYGNITMIGFQKVNTYTIVYDKNGGVGDTIDSYEVEELYTNTYTIIDWSLNVVKGHFSINHYSVKGHIIEGTTIDISDLVAFAETYENNSVITIKLDWIGDSFAITYKIDGQVSVQNPATHIYGTETILPIPEKEGFLFNGWYIGDSLIKLTTLSADGYTDNIELRGNYEIIYVKITFNKPDGTKLSEKSIPYNYHFDLLNNNGTYYQEPLEKEHTKEFNYTFENWLNVVDDSIVTNLVVKEPITLKPKYTPVLRIYVVKFLDSDNETVYDTKQLAYGVNIIYDTTPEKASDLVFSYEFKHWSLTINGDEIIYEVNNVLITDVDSNEVLIYPVYSATYINYTIKFFGGLDNDELKGTYSRHFGETISYFALPQIKQVQYTYTFEGWLPYMTTPALKADFDSTTNNDLVKDTAILVRSDKNYYAQFTYQINTYTITFVNFNNTPYDTKLTTPEMDNQLVKDYGTILDLTLFGIPEKIIDGNYNYTFKGWYIDGEIAVYTSDFEVKKNATLIPKFSEKLKVCELYFYSEVSNVSQNSEKKYVDELFKLNVDVTKEFKIWVTSTLNVKINYVIDSASYSNKEYTNFKKDPAGGLQFVLQGVNYFEANDVNKTIKSFPIDSIFIIEKDLVIFGDYKSETRIFSAVNTETEPIQENIENPEKTSLIINQNVLTKIIKFFNNDVAKIEYNKNYDLTVEKPTEPNEDATQTEKDDYENKKRVYDNFIRIIDEVKPVSDKYTYEFSEFVMLVGDNEENVNSICIENESDIEKYTVNGTLNPIYPKFTQNIRSYSLFYYQYSRQSETDKTTTPLKSNNGTGSPLEVKSYKYGTNLEEIVDNTIYPYRKTNEKIYTFLGWNTNKDATEPLDFKELTIVKDYKLYPIYSKADRIYTLCIYLKENSKPIRKDFSYSKVKEFDVSEYQIKEKDENYTYKFIKWTDSESNEVDLVAGESNTMVLSYPFDKVNARDEFEIYANFQEEKIFKFDTNVVYYILYGLGGVVVLLLGIFIIKGLVGRRGSGLNNGKQADGTISDIREREEEVKQRRQEIREKNQRLEERRLNKRLQNQNSQQTNNLKTNIQQNANGLPPKPNAPHPVNNLPPKPNASQPANNLPPKPKLPPKP